MLSRKTVLVNYQSVKKSWKNKKEFFALLIIFILVNHLIYGMLRATLGIVDLRDYAIFPLFVFNFALVGLGFWLGMKGAAYEAEDEVKYEYLDMLLSETTSNAIKEQAAEKILCMRNIEEADLRIILDSTMPNSRLNDLAVEMFSKMKKERGKKPKDTDA